MIFDKIKNLGIFKEELNHYYLQKTLAIQINNSIAINDIANEICN